MQAEPVPSESSSSCLSQTTVAAIEREVLDEDGDVLIKSGFKEFLVSSKILTLASPVFKAMFRSGFIEGTTVRSAEHPLELPLSDDNPDALTVLLHILHFSPSRKCLKSDVDLQLELAQLSKKYDCIASISAEGKQ